MADPATPAKPNRIPEGLVMSNDRVARAHQAQLQHVARTFESHGWTQTEFGFQYKSSRINNAQLGWVRMTDSVMELRVNYVYETGRKNVFVSRLGVLAKPAKNPPSGNDEGLRILHTEAVEVAFLDELMNWFELNDEERAERALNELEFQGLMDIERMLPAARLQEALACLNP